jgi:hypothetical protein
VMLGTTSRQTRSASPPSPPAPGHRSPNNAVGITMAELDVEMHGLRPKPIQRRSGYRSANGRSHLVIVATTGSISPSSSPPSRRQPAASPSGVRRTVWTNRFEALARETGASTHYS